MSLNGGHGAWTLEPADGGGPYLKPQTPMLDDIEAIQSLYDPGHSADPHPGGTTYGFNCSLAEFDQERRVYDFTINQTPLLTIYDPDGPNVLDTSGTSFDETINLNPGTYSSVLGMRDNVALAYETTMWRAIGGGGDDKFIVPSGSFVIDGGPGTNKVDYSGLSSGFKATLDGAYTTVDKTSPTQDVLTNISQFVGGAGDDTFNVDVPRVHMFDGGGSAKNGNTLSYASDLAAVHVVMEYPAAGEVKNLSGTVQDTFSNIQNITGSSHDDTFTGGSGSYHLHGGAGTDTLNYSWDTAKLTVDLQKGQAWKNGTDATQVDTIDGFEHFVGGSGGTTFKSRADILHDYTFDGGSGIDTLDYAWDAGGITVDLLNQTVDKGKSGWLSNGTDHFSSIEQFIGGGGTKFPGRPPRPRHLPGRRRDRHPRPPQPGRLPVDHRPQGREGHRRLGQLMGRPFFGNREFRRRLRQRQAVQYVELHGLPQLRWRIRRRHRRFRWVPQHYTWSTSASGHTYVSIADAWKQQASNLKGVGVFDGDMDLVNVEHIQFSDGTYDLNGTVTLTSNQVGTPVVVSTALATADHAAVADHAHAESLAMTSKLVDWHFA